VKLWRARYSMLRMFSWAVCAMRLWGHTRSLGKQPLISKPSLPLDSDSDDDMSDRSLTPRCSLVGRILSFLQAGFHTESTPILKKILIKEAISEVPRFRALQRRGIGYPGEKANKLEYFSDPIGVQWSVWRLHTMARQRRFSGWILSWATSWQDST